MKLFSILILLFALVSCGNQGDGGNYSESAPTGTIAKQWNAITISRGNLFSAGSVDLSAGLTATFSDVKKSERKFNGSREYWVHTVSDCSYTIDAGTPGDDFSITYQSTLTSGNPDVCDSLTPSFQVKHYRGSNRDFDILRVAGSHMQ